MTLETHIYFVNIVYIGIYFSKGMERKVIQVGKSSLVVSLPKKWTERANIKRGSTINIEEITSGELVIRPHTVEEKVKVIVLDAAVGDIREGLVNAYINGYHRIKITSADIPRALDAVYEILGDLTGLEVIHAESEEAIVEYYGEPIPPRKLLNRFSIILSTYIESIVTSFNEKQSRPLMNIRKIRERDRLHHAILRNILIASSSTKTASELEISSPEIVYYSLLAENFRDMVAAVEGIEYSETSHDKVLSEIFHTILEIYKDTQKAWARKDDKAIRDMSSRIDSLTKKILATRNEVSLNRDILPSDEDKGLIQTYFQSKARKVKDLVTTPENVFVKELLDRALELVKGISKSAQVYCMMFAKEGSIPK